MRYRLLRRPNHPLADASGRVAEHRLLLYERLGPGQHPCHWCGAMLEWKRHIRAGAIVIDHIDFNGMNNQSDNIVASCNSCNTRRGRWNEVKDDESFVVTPGRLGPVRQRTVERTCPSCETVFFPTVAKVKIGRGRYCSRACQMTAARAARVYPTPEEKYVERECVRCGATFQTTRWLVEHGFGLCCSRSCAAGLAARNRKPRAAPQI